MSTPNVRIEPSWITEFKLVRGIGRPDVVTPAEIQRIWVDDVLVYCQPSDAGGLGAQVTQDD